MFTSTSGSMHSMTTHTLDRMLSVWKLWTYYFWPTVDKTYERPCSALNVHLSEGRQRLCRVRDSLVLGEKKWSWVGGGMVWGNWGWIEGELWMNWGSVGGELCVNRVWIEGELKASWGWIQWKLWVNRL